MLWRASLSDDANERQQFIAAAEHCHAHNVRFPNSLDEVQMLQSLGDSAFARYLLGCFWYSKRRYDEAVSCWRETLEKSPDYAPAHRLLGVYSWNKQQDATHALAYLQRAVALEPDNARFLFELDFLQKLLARPVHERLTTLVERKAVVLKRDDLTAELLSLWNASGHYADAAAILDTRVFHPWEGGEGKITGQYLLNQLHRALQFIERGAFKQATDCLKAALRYPDNLGEGRLPGQTDNDIWYLLGYCAEQAGDAQQAAEYYQLARQGAQRWTPGGTTTINPPITFSGRALRCVRAVTQRRPSSTSAILSTGPRSIGMTFRKSIFLPSLFRTWWFSMYQRSRDISSTACLLKRWAIWGWATYPPASRGCSSFCK